MKVYRYILLTILCFVASATTLNAQQRISGQVSDAMGPLMMVNVVEIDKDNRIVEHSTTDFDGNFTMIVKNNKNKLKFSYVGFQDVVLEIGTRTVFNVTMKDDNQIQEVVIQARPRSKSGGLDILEREVSVAKQTFKMSEMEGLSFASVDEALQGQIAGLDIVFNSGDLGSGTQMRLRGTSTINGNQEPLIVVNDNIFEMPDGEDFDFTTANEEKFAQLLTVNPEDIESIEVLKDASASAIWGSRGSNGVIMIKTKRGSRGKTKVTYSYRFKDKWLPKGLNLLNGDDYTMFLKEAHFNPTQSSTASNAQELNYNTSFAEYENFNNNTDWVDAISKHGQTHEHNLSLTGGGEKATFRVSGGYYKESGQIIKQKLDRFTTRMALDYYVSDRIRVSSDFALTYTNNNKNFQDLLPVAQIIMPNMSIWAQDPQGNNTDDYYLMRQNASGIFDKNQKDIINPVAMGNLAWRKEKSYRIAPQISLDYQLLGLNHDETQLRYYGMVYMDANTLSNSSYRPSSLTTKGVNDGDYNASSTNDNKTLSFNTRHRLQFLPKFSNPDHVTQFMAQFEMTTGNGNSQASSSSGIPTGIISTTTGTRVVSSSTSTWQWRSVAVLAQAFYSYKEGRYSATATLRRDGSTKFGANNRWGNFPSLSLRWNIIDEPWMQWAQDKIKLSMLSLRPGWGMTGSQPGSEYLHYTTYDTSGQYMGTTSIAQGGLRLTDLKWAKKNEYNIGTDFAFFPDEKLSGSFNYYDNNTTDQLMGGYAIPSSNGYSSLAYKNTGAVRNWGWELNISGNKFIKVGDFSVTAYANVAQNFNTILEMEESVLNNTNKDFDYKNGSYLNRIQLGNPLGSLYGFKFKGVYMYNYNTNWTKERWAQAEQELAAEGKKLHDYYPVAGDADGNTIYGADGKPLRMAYNFKDGSAPYSFRGGDAMYDDINHDGNINQLDIVYLGNSNPKLQGGFGVTLQYKRLSLKSQFTYRYGVDVINSARMNVENMHSNNNQSIAVNWRWRKEGDATMMPRAMYNTGYNWLGSDRYLEDASYLRMSFLQASYSFDPAKLKKYGMNQLYLSASADNLFILSKYTGLDPEIGANGWGQAFDNSKTPRSRSFTLNLTIGF
ncbi:MAG: SusC/RagA family TonB-linked outer membrane protein [Bacteroidaceae bacterium]|nr:SusC/RagA family TonB-linked outer membrane protein [Bacteroidaceae bacterium]MBQ7967944.1 SusC/RagA family TonB-linked outer membrane protein [Bacteroidaceae bacterium]